MEGGGHHHGDKSLVMHMAWAGASAEQTAPGGAVAWARAPTCSERDLTGMTGGLHRASGCNCVRDVTPRQGVGFALKVLGLTTQLIVRSCGYFTGRCSDMTSCLCGGAVIMI